MAITSALLLPFFRQRAVAESEEAL